MFFKLRSLFYARCGQSEIRIFGSHIDRSQFGTLSFEVIHSLMHKRHASRFCFDDQLQQGKLPRVPVDILKGGNAANLLEY